MIRQILTIATLIVAWCPAMAQRPDWVVSHPVSDTHYVGVGSALVSDPDHVHLATQRALADIAAQVATHVEANSFLHTIDNDGLSRELFEERVHNSITGYLEGQKLDASYSDGKTYYVKYSLERKAYARLLEKRRTTAIGEGLAALQQGRDALDAGSLVTAIQTLSKGLEAVAPWTFLNLSAEDGGRTIDVAGELYRTYLNAFDGLTITLDEYNIKGEPFKAVASPVAACLSRAGITVPGVKLSAAFTRGSGDVTPAIATDDNGTAEFYITNITSRDAVQELRVTIDESFKSSLPKAYASLLPPSTWPEAKVTIQVTLAAPTAYIHATGDELKGCAQQVKQILANQHFTVIDDPDVARIFVELKTSMDLGGTVAGELYDLNECHATLTLKFYDTSNEQLMLDYGLLRMRVLVPQNKSVEQTEAQCVRELMKRVKNELPQKLKNIRL